MKIETLRKSFPNHVFSEYGGPFAQSQPLNHLPYLAVDVFKPEDAEPMAAMCADLGFKVVHLTFPLIWGDYEFDMAQFPNGQQNAWEAVQSFKKRGIKIYLETMTMAIHPYAKRANDSRVLKHANGKPLTMPYWPDPWFLPNAELLEEIAATLAQLYNELGCDGGIYFDGADWTWAAQAAGLISSTEEYNTRFMESVFRRLREPCPCGTAYPTSTAYWLLSNYQASDCNLPNDNYQLWVDKHAADVEEKCDDLVPFMGWSRLPPTADDLEYFFSTCKRLKANYSMKLITLEMLKDPKLQGHFEVIRFYNHQ